MAETMLHDTPLSLFQTRLATLARPLCQAAFDATANNAACNVIADQGMFHFSEPEHVNAALNAIIDRLVPKKALQCVKHYLHQE